MVCHELSVSFENLSKSVTFMDAGLLKMNNIYSEKELLPPGISLGQWEFTLSKDEIDSKLKSLPTSQDSPNNVCEHWGSLMSLLIKKDVKTSDSPSKNESVLCVVDEEPMECSSDIDLVETEQVKNSSALLNDVEDITVSLVDNCNQVAQKKFKPGCYFDDEESSSVVPDLQKLDESVMSLVVKRAWPQLNSDVSKMCFCATFCLEPDWCEILCRQVLVPWMNKSLPNKLEQFSEIFSKQGEIFCKHLMAPLLQMEESPFVKDLLNLEEIMSSMSKTNWTTILKDLISGLNELPSWIIPVLAVVVEHSDPSFDELRVLVQLMSSGGSNFAKSREFGALLVAVAVCIKPGFGSVIPQIKLITNTYKGPLKFKVLKILSEIKD